MMMRHDANKKSVGVAQVLRFFPGMLGAHRFYVGLARTATVILILTIISWVLASALVGLVLIIIPAVSVLVDAFPIPGMVRDYNNSLITRIST